jgi:hypothetical protein
MGRRTCASQEHHSFPFLVLWTASTPQSTHVYVRGFNDYTAVHVHSCVACGQQTCVVRVSLSLLNLQIDMTCRVPKRRALSLFKFSLLDTRHVLLAHRYA